VEKPPEHLGRRYIFVEKPPLSSSSSSGAAPIIPKKNLPNSHLEKNSPAYSDRTILEKFLNS